MLAIILLVVVVYAYNVGGIKTSLMNSIQSNNCPNGIIPNNLNFYYGSTFLDNSGWIPAFSNCWKLG